MERQVKLTVRRKDGSTLLEQAQSIERQRGYWPPEILLPDLLPDNLEWWEWYWELRSVTPYGSAGPNPIPYSEIEAWQRLTKREISTIDVDMILSIDRAYLTEMNNQYSQR